MNLGWILVGYIQDGLSVPFGGPIEIGSRVLQGGQKWPENAINKAFLALGGSGGSKWMDLSGYWLELGGIHPEWSEGTIWTHQNCPQGPPLMAINARFMAFLGQIFGGSKWPQLTILTHPDPTNIH